jgi:hypothetical protein
MKQELTLRQEDQPLPFEFYWLIFYLFSQPFSFFNFTCFLVLVLFYKYNPYLLYIINLFIFELF